MHSFDNLMGEIAEGGTDTTASQLQSLVLALAKFPEAQKRAQLELDDVCGNERSPMWSDFEQLPYVNAIIKESARWRSS
jgi:cytochrome P450